MQKVVATEVDNAFYLITKNWHFKGFVADREKFFSLLMSIDEYQLLCGPTEDLKKLVIELQQFAGSFFVMFVSGQEVLFFVSDLFANQRMYLNEALNGEIKLHSAPLKGEVSEDDYSFFRYKGYSPADASLWKGVRKVFPGEYYICGEFRSGYGDGLLPLIRGSNHDPMYDLEQQFLLSVKQHSGPIVLAFSGGLDSLWLQQVLAKHGIKHSVCFVDRCPRDHDSATDLELVKRTSVIFGFDVDILELDVEKAVLDETLKSKVTKGLPEDRAFAYDIYSLFSHVRNKYGHDSLIITGQSSDSLFCWGLSSLSLSSFIQRIMTSKYYLKNSFIRYIFKIGGVGNKGDKKIRIPLEDNLAMLFLPDGYVLRSDYNMLAVASIIRSRILNRFSEKLSVSDERFFAKLNYLQGSSNILWFSASDSYGVKCHMPYLTKSMLGILHNSFNSWKTILFPRYQIWRSLFNLAGYRSTLFYFFTRYGPFKTKGLAESKEFNKLYSRAIDRW